MRHSRRPLIEFGEVKLDGVKIPGDYTGRQYVRRGLSALWLSSLVSFTIAFTSIHISAGSSHLSRFEDFSVESIEAEKIPKIRLEIPWSHHFRTQIERGIDVGERGRAQPNLAGHFRVVTWV